MNDNRYLKNICVLYMQGGGGGNPKFSLIPSTSQTFLTLTPTLTQDCLFSLLKDNKNRIQILKPDYIRQRTVQYHIVCLKYISPKINHHEMTSNPSNKIYMSHDKERQNIIRIAYIPISKNVGGKC